MVAVVVELVDLNDDETSDRRGARNLVYTGMPICSMNLLRLGMCRLYNEDALNIEKDGSLSALVVESVRELRFVPN